MSRIKSSTSSVEILLLQASAPQLGQGMGRQCGEGPGHRHLGGLIARHIQAKGIGGAEESGQGPVAAITPHPKGSLLRRAARTWRLTPGS